MNKKKVTLRREFKLKMESNDNEIFFTTELLYFVQSTRVRMREAKKIRKFLAYFETFSYSMVLREESKNDDRKLYRCGL